MFDDGGYVMRNDIWGRFMGGLVLIGIGVIFLFNQLGITDLSIGYLFSTYWPVFLILAGITHFANGGRRNSNLVGSLILIVIGGYFLARNLDLISLSAGDFFRFFLPGALIFGGLYMLFRPSRYKSSQSDNFTKSSPPVPPVPPVPPMNISEIESPLDSIFGSMEKEQAKKEYNFNQNKHSYEHYDMGGTYKGKAEAVNKSGFIGDVRIGQDYFQLKPMNISHFIGDTIIDLTKAQIPYGETKINVSAFIGDVKVFIPDDMDLGIVATSNAFVGDLKVLNQKEGGFMSSVQVESPHYGEASKKVKLIVSVFIGDVKVNMVG
ncbi:hypothetical protein D3C76_600970 [compost metagenome]